MYRLWSFTGTCDFQIKHPTPTSGSTTKTMCVCVRLHVGVIWCSVFPWLGNHTILKPSFKSCGSNSGLMFQDRSEASLESADSLLDERSGFDTGLVPVESCLSTQYQNARTRVHVWIVGSSEPVTPLPKLVGRWSEPRRGGARAAPNRGCAGHGAWPRGRMVVGDVFPALGRFGRGGAKIKSPRGNSCRADAESNADPVK